MRFFFKNPVPSVSSLLSSLVLNGREFMPSNYEICLRFADTLNNIVECIIRAYWDIEGYLFYLV